MNIKIKDKSEIILSTFDKSDTCVAGQARNGAKMQPRVRRKARGQVIPIIALALLVLVAIVGLAVDGGSMFGQRREAQNASDGAAMASTRKMLELYQAMIKITLVDRNGYASEENLIKAELDATAARNGIDVNSENVKAYFVNDQKQIVTSYTGGDNGCGAVNPCQVGDNNSVPWRLGAKGIIVTTQAATGSFFMAIFGHNEVSSSASATAYMGIASDTRGEVGLLPIGFFTETVRLANLEVGRNYTLIEGSTRQGSGNWGYIDFNGRGNPVPVVNAWIACGYNPTIRTLAEWQRWCTISPHNGESRAFGPIQYWTGSATPYEVENPVLTGPYESEFLEWPADPDGWWVAGSSGTTMSTCQFFQEFAARTLNDEYYVPVFDRNNGQGGNNTKFHLIGLARFRILDEDIRCNNEGGDGEHWAVRGTYLSRISTGGVGRHGDVRHTSNPVVFLEP